MIHFVTSTCIYVNDEDVSCNIKTSRHHKKYGFLLVLDKILEDETSIEKWVVGSMKLYIFIGWKKF